MDNTNQQKIKEALQAVKKLIVSFKENLEPTLPLSNGPTVMFAKRGMGILRIQDEEAINYKKCLSQLHESIIGKGEDNFSKKAVESHLQNAILKALDVNEQINGSFDDKLKLALNELETSLQAEAELWQIYMRVNGLSLDGLPFIAGKVTFHKGDTFTVDGLMEKADPIFQNITGEHPVNRVNRDYFYNDLKEAYLENVIATVEVRAVDDDAARSLAIKELQLTIDVLNYFSDIIHPKGINTRIYLPGESHETEQLFVSLRRDQQYTIFHASAGPDSKFSLKPEAIKRAQSAGLDEILALLKKDHLNSMEQRILASFQWAGRATIEQQTEKAFLLYAIALESLLLGKKNESEITYRLTRKCAHLLGKEQNLDQRKQMVKDVKNLYTLRSKIVHTGQMDISGSQLGMMWHYVKVALKIVLSTEPFNKMTSEKEFEDWFEDQILSASITPTDTNPPLPPATLSPPIPAF